MHPRTRHLKNLGRWAALLLLALPARAATHYVALTSTNPVPPYLTWDTAATNIQDAIDVSVSNDTVLVSNGVYATGGRVVYGMLLTNRIAITNPISVLSVNGPNVTTIRGNNAPATNKNPSVRCVFMVDGSTLAGFSLTNGSTRASFDDDGSGGGVWCQSSAAVLSNCVLLANNANYIGGGAYGGTLWNCKLIKNASGYYGGGVHAGVLYNSILFSNSVTYYGGGAAYSELRNCTIVANAAGSSGAGGGTFDCAVENSINYFNKATLGTNYYAGTALFSCTTPIPAGDGNFSDDPQLASLLTTNVHLLPGSPCIDSGTNQPWMASAVDLDDEARTNGIVDVGADEFWLGGLSGPLGAGITASYSNAATGFPITFRGSFIGNIQTINWQFGNGLSATNLPAVYHAFATAGTFAVTLTVSNLSSSAAATVQVQVVDGNYFVATNGSDGAAGTNWSTAKRTIQAAVDLAAVGGTVWVSNGTYSSGATSAVSHLTRVSIYKPLTVRSISGPDFTRIVGASDPASTFGPAAIRCAYLGSNSSLIGFSVTNGHAAIGGGVWCELSAVVSNCIIVGNSASANGGGLYQGSFYNCTVAGNSAGNVGGGSFIGTLVNCTLSGNSAASYGGGSFDGTLYNCILSGNSAGADGGGSSTGIMYNCTLFGNFAASDGGGSDRGVLYNCIFYGNSAVGTGGGCDDGLLYNCTLFGNSAAVGGGSSDGTLNNCTLSGNSAQSSGGGSYRTTLRNCIVYFNTAPNSPNNSGGSLVSSCTTPPATGAGNITNSPQFVDAANSNFHLLATSPCIDRGNNAYVQGTTDLDGNPRIAYGVVDMGAYEAQFPVGYWVWAGAITNGLTNITDSATGDGYANLLKYATGSSPTDNDALASLGGELADGFFALRFNRNTNASDVTLVVEGSESATNGAPWQGIATNVLGSWGGATNIVEAGTGTPVTVSVADPSPATNRFLRLRVSRP